MLHDINILEIDINCERFCRTTLLREIKTTSFCDNPILFVVLLVKCNTSTKKFSPFQNWHCMLILNIFYKMLYSCFLVGQDEEKHYDSSFGIF